MTSRFHIPRSIDLATVSIELTRDEAHHLSRVLRLQTGDAVVVFDTGGNEFNAQIASISSHGASVQLLGAIERPRNALRHLTVAISPIRPEAMSWLVQKLTELGVARLAPFVSRRTALPHAAEAESDEAHRRRWERVSLAACKQCGRSLPLEILPAQPFEAVASELAWQAELRLFAWEGGDAAPMAAVLREQLSEAVEHPKAALLIGPEGGFAVEEYEHARSCGFVPVDLGPYILRAETAAIVAASLILNLGESV